jgi:purine-binding chemotaxis protein CheW
MADPGVEPGSFAAEGTAVVRAPAASLSLLCRVGSRLCALGIEHVVETLRPLPIEPVAEMPPFILGLSVIRGVPLPVVDAGRLLGTSDTVRAGRFVVLRLGERRAALAVDAVEGMRVLPSAALRELPALLGQASRDLVAAVGALDAELLLVLRSSRIVPDAAWDAVMAAARR